MSKDYPSRDDLIKAYNSINVVFMAFNNACNNAVNDSEKSMYKRRANEMVSALEELDYYIKAYR